MNLQSQKVNYPQMTIFPEIKRKTSTNSEANRKSVLSYLQKLIKTKKKDGYLDFDQLKPAFTPFRANAQGEFDDGNLREQDDLILKNNEKNSRAGTNRNSTLGNSYLGNRSVSNQEYSKLLQSEIKSSRRHHIEHKELGYHRNSPVGMGIAIPPNLNFYDDFSPQPEHIEYLKSKTKGESLASSRNEQISLFTQRNSQPNAQVHFFPDEFPAKEVKVYDYHRKFVPKYIKPGEGTQRNLPVKVVNLLSVNGSDIPIRYKPKEIPKIGKTRETRETIENSAHQIYKLDKRTPVKLIEESITLKPENNTLLTRSIERDKRRKKLNNTENSPDSKYEYTWEGKSISKVLLNKKSSDKLMTTDLDNPSSPLKYYNTDEYSPSRLSKVFKKKNVEVQKLDLAGKVIPVDPVLSSLILKKTMKLSPRETAIPRSEYSTRKRTIRSDENGMHHNIPEADTENDTIKGWDEDKINNYHESELNSFGMKY